LILYWLWLSIKARSLFFFSASNPSILMGGMMGESKYDVLTLLPNEVKPKTIRVSIPSSKGDVITLLVQHGLSLPVVFKPDLGERGWMVKIIRSDDDITSYLAEIKVDFIIQEFVNLPFEFGVFYVRYPSEEKGFVNSITMKEFLSVEGDGRSTLRDLILKKDRAKLQWETLRESYRERLDKVIAANEKVELVPIGNHCLGTTFLNTNYLITSKLNESFDRISKQINGFYFGRYDLRCESLQDLEQGKVKVVELNGCGAEPAHIYHPGSSIREAFKVLFVHWRNLYLISVQNHARGVPYISFREGLQTYNRFKEVKSLQ
jgi:hypothetical protein